MIPSVATDLTVAADVRRRIHGHAAQSASTRRRLPRQRLGRNVLTAPSTLMKGPVSVPQLMQVFVRLVPLLLLTACAGPRYTIQPVLQPGQTVLPVASDQVCAKCGKVHGQSRNSHPLQAHPVIESKRQHTVVVRQLQSEIPQHGRPEFHVSVQNNGAASLNFSLANVEVRRNGNLSKTFTLEEMMAERDAAAAAEAAAAQGVAMGMQMSAQINANMAQMSLNNAVQPGVNNAYRYQQLNNAQSYINQGMMQDSMARSYAINAALTSPQYHGLQFVLRPITIAPGQSGGGNVVTDYVNTPGPHTLGLKVNIADELHEFKFQIQEKTKN